MLFGKTAHVLSSQDGRYDRPALEARVAIVLHIDASFLAEFDFQQSKNMIV